jgi:quercetin dioxygenase-like cupin family protein
MTIEKALSGLHGRQLQGHTLTFDLNREMDALLARAHIEADGLASKTLVKQGPMRITLVTVRQGAALHAHHVEAPSSIQVLRGTMRFMSDSGEVLIAADDLLTLAPAVVHEGTALSDCALLLTIVKL